MDSISISDCERRFREGRWTQQLVDDIWRLVTDSSDADAIILAYDIQHCLNGLSAEHLNRFDAWQKCQGNTCWSLFWRLLSAELQLGLAQEAGSRLHGLEKQRWSLRRALALYRFPLALNHIHQQKNCGCDFLTLRMARLATSLLERTTTLTQWCEELFAQQKGDCPVPRIAVVGNGPSLRGRAAGERIDSADLVIRFNQIHTGESMRHDTGQQTGLWVVSPGFSINGSKMPCHNLCLSGPAPFMRSSRYWSRLARLPFTSLALTPLDSWYSLVRLLEAPPSAGILVLHTLMEHFPNLHIEVHGFTVDTIESEDRNRAGSHYGDCHKVSTRHDWRKESLLIQQWISKRELRLEG